MGEVLFSWKNPTSHNLDCAWNLRCCVGHNYIIKHEPASPLSSFIAYLCLWLHRAPETGDMLVYCLDWFHCHSPVLSLIWQPPSELSKAFFFFSFWARKRLGSLHKSRYSTSSIGRKRVPSSEVFPQLTGSKMPGPYRRCRASQQTTAKITRADEKACGLAEFGSNFSSTHLHSPFLGNQQGDVGCDY